jgi:hypothetical protein
MDKRSAVFVDEPIFEVVVELAEACIILILDDAVIDDMADVLLSAPRSSDGRFDPEDSINCT